MSECSLINDWLISDYLLIFVLFLFLFLNNNKTILSEKKCEEKKKFYFN